MRFTSPSRRALGLVAASTIGMSTAVLGVTGVATAAPVAGVPLAPISVATFNGDTSLTVPAGYCTGVSTVLGAEGGGKPATNTNGEDPDSLEVYLVVQPGQVYTLAAGAAGGDATTGNGAGGVNSAFSGVNGGLGQNAGGGGAGSVLALGGEPVATAAGGAGGGAGAGAGGGTTGVSPSAVVQEGRTPQVTEGSTATGAGSVTFQIQPCAAPYSPTLVGLTAGNGTAAATFIPAGRDERTAAPSGYEYAVNGGDWVPLTPAQVTASQFDVPNLTNGTSYSVTMRSLSAANGPGEVSTARTVTPYAPIGSATITSVKTAPGAITVTWAAPTTVGTYARGGYEVYVSSEELFGLGCDAEASETSCTFAAEPGVDFRIVVVALDSEGHADPVGSAPKNSGVVPGLSVPTAVPTKDDGDVRGPAGPITSLTAGQKVTLIGEGFLPFSDVQLTVFSSPVSLGTVETDQDGKFSVEVTIPANLTNGTHSLVATGVAPDGSTRNLVITVTVSGGVATLANTGFDTAVPLTGGALALLAGAGLLVGARRRSN